jgi:hypothetical protein
VKKVKMRVIRKQVDDGDKMIVGEDDDCGEDDEDNMIGGDEEEGEDYDDLENEDEK